ncbi:3-hydroxybutyryl-CoA dehydrogenase [Fulvivirgaceae bacterium PWU4]|uniref:3-hydroxybutyryl-CoA dehydrogenase n=1 Tax=Chryseosolibacter histidini TaxID=2782349 RepID=A0AAP2DQV6_9BACT|nr:3-hydroxyacyl-CoA dehydrogenase NAD-binding domain-containing protein [Chryseosolibacter histidini]MBT1699572.1 3-hydroxybutyryl-CoA dehydrogenase [Chryseosolibacter histidini]
MTVDAIKSVAVVGAGTMGQGIAQVCAAAGYKVLLYDIQPDLISNALERIRKNLVTLVEKGKITAAQKDSVTALITPVSDFRQLQVELVIEAVIEKLEVKQKIFAELEKINDQSCILTTNTSSIPITQIAASLKYPQRFAGLHFFNPAPAMKLVEIVKGTATTDETVQLLFQLAQKLSKQAVLAQDSPGFIVNRVARHYYVEALKLLEENVADFKTIDALLRATGFKMGPFELMDLIGVDVNFSVTTSMFNAFHHDPKFRPSRIQQQKVDAGHHGRKTGKGFYDYE